MDSRELSEWIAFYGLHPFGEDAADVRAGIIASTVANCLTVDGGFRPSDFIPQYKRQREPQTEQDIQAAILKVNALLGGTVRK